MSRQVISGDCHPVEQKNDDFATLWHLSPDREELNGVTLRLSGGCHLMEKSWMEVGHEASSSGLRSKRRLFIASALYAKSFSRVYDHSLPHNQLATSDLLLDYASDPLAGLAGRRVSHFAIFLF
ncbi:unnamed protein product [Spirodela intermedia]|uniref:Uncharacterized protein n=1 Tax=Spirodela intermedia TaxID=51605 RepID=A0A7I8LDQ8_SPIIN|nr:unnamed protein product [Spirodela intermedia]